MKEVWKDIKGYEDSYQVSNFGKVKSLDRIIIKSNGIKQKTKGVLLKLKVRNNGYYEVILKSNQNFKCKLVHRLVANAFIETSELHVNHIDGDKSNNTVNNLEFVTHLENMNHRVRTLENKQKFGVHFHKNNRRWIVSINIKDYPHYVGSYNCKEEAHDVFYIIYSLTHEVAPW